MRSIGKTFPSNQCATPVNKPAIILASVLLLAVAGFFVFLSPQASEANTVMVVYKDPNCGCCADWIDHIQAAGIEVDVRDTSEMNQVKLQHGVSRGLSSCHTALIDGYVVEGHVPAEDVLRMLQERPQIKGLAVPGMPIGSPGMEQGDPADYDAYDVVAFDGAGNLSRYRHIEGGVNSKP